VQEHMCSSTSAVTGRSSTTGAYGCSPRTSGAADTARRPRILPTGLRVVRLRRRRRTVASPAPPSTRRRTPSPRHREVDAGLSTLKPSDPGGCAASANAGRSRSLRITGAGSPIGGASLSRSQGTPHSGRRPQCSPVPVVRQVQLALPVLPTPRHSAVSSERETGAAESSPPPLKASQPSRPTRTCVRHWEGG
jgi:hypothetical protein